MGRPFKKPEDRKTTDIRIPMREADKRLVEEAMALDGQQLATWARDLILTEAQNLLAAARKKTRKGSD